MMRARGAWRCLATLVLATLVIAPNARTVFKYVDVMPPVPFVAYVLLSLGLVFLLTRGQILKEWITGYWFIVMVVLLASLVVWFMYPIADGLKSEMRGSDADDCVILGAGRLAMLLHPYKQPTLYGNPCSAGVGMLVLYLPFVLPGIYPLGAFAAGLAAIWAVNARTKSLYVTAVFTMLLFGSIYIIEVLVTGTDLFLLGCGLVVLALWLIPAVARKNMAMLLGLAVLAGLLSSTRVNFLIVAPVMAAYIFVHWKQGALWFAAVAIGVAAIPSASIYLLSPADFAPLHLIGKAGMLLHGWLKEAGILFSVAGFAAGAYLVRRSIGHLPSALLLSLAPSLIAVAIGEFIVRKVNPALWEGANYLLPVIPLCLTILVVQMVEEDTGHRLPDGWKP